MPEIFYSHTHKAWVKECTGPCNTMFEVQAINITEAEGLMKEYFGNGSGVNGLRSDCKSCFSNRNKGRHQSNHRDELLKEQDGKCALCPTEIAFKDRTAFVDHCHISGITRAILCRGCNLGMAAIDNDEWIAKAIAYRDSYRISDGTRTS